MGGNMDYYPLTTPVVFRRPAPPTNITAKLEGAALQHVNITWNLSADENLCYDRVKNYSIYYSSEYDSDGKGYQFLAEVPKGTDYYVHWNAGEGDPNTYFYTVQVNDIYTYSGRNETQVAKYTRDLDAGQHLVSIPLVLNNTNITSVLQTVKFDIAWYYDNSDPADPWKSFNPSKPVNDLHSVDHTMGLWLVVNEDCNLTVAGTVPRITLIPLGQGWNLIGYPSFIERTVLEAFTGVLYERVEGYSTMPPEYLQLLSPTSIMTPGYGYWIKVASPTVWALLG
jgi:hypothetical protein